MAGTQLHLGVSSIYHYMATMPHYVQLCAAMQLSLHLISGGVTACRRLLQRPTWFDCSFPGEIVLQISWGESHPARSEHLPCGKDSSKLLRELPGNAGGHHLCSGLYETRFVIPKKMNKGLRKLNLRNFLMLVTKGSLGLLMESIFTLKEVLVTTSML